MNRKIIFVVIPLLGYFGLWILGTILFLVYFDLFSVSLDLPYNTMIERIPALLAIATVPLCSFASFFLSTRVLLRKIALDTKAAFELGVVSLISTIGLDLLITVGIQRVDISLFPANFMYLFAYLVIVPSVVLAAYHKHS
ncbi:MAG: hypothetical protein JRN20_19945 [Nitrososphaerota archaeon]|nr:hypothetical protein [Nitrososphaerota archaeon]